MPDRRYHPGEAAAITKAKRQLATAINSKRSAEERIEAAVLDLRYLGMTWADIGVLLGVKRQSVQERFLPKYRAAEKALYAKFKGVIG